MAETREHMKVIGKDGTPLGTVDRVEGDRIKQTKTDSQDTGHEAHQLAGAVEGLREALSQRRRSVEV
jgi:hypothetical protein